MRLLLSALFILPLHLFAAPLTIDDFIRPVEIEEVKISPSGSHIAVRKLYEGERTLIFMSLHPLKITGSLYLKGNEEFGDFDWVNNRRVVAKVITRTASLETMTDYGTLFAVDYDGSRGKTIFGYSAGEVQTGSAIEKAEATYAHATLIDSLPDDDQWVLISTYPWANDWETRGEIYKLNVYTGVKKKVSGLPQVGGRGFTDGKGNLLFANGYDPKNKYELYARINKNWQIVEDPILRTGVPVGFNPETSDAFLIVEQKGKTEKLVRWNLKTGKHQDIYQHELADITDIIQHPKKQVPVGLNFDPDYPKYHFFDDDHVFPALYRGIGQAFNGNSIAFTSSSDDGSKTILKVSSDQLPGDYYLFDLDSRKVQFILSSADWIKHDDLNPMQAESFVAEDGFRIGVYLTLPKGRDSELPMVVIPHGGPHSRDYWEYGEEAQLLSRHGYAVLQVNFRGSSGYGEAFYDASRGHWGDKVQNDIADAVKWAISQGYADSKRICIYGASFGGYSALMNPIRFPDLYQCAAGYAGVYDLELMYAKGDIQRRERGLAYLRREITEDKAKLLAHSPRYNVDKLQLPIFIIHGKKDKRAPAEHAKQLVKELTSEKKDVKSLFIPNEGHGFYGRENKLLLYTELLEFFDKHIGIGSSEKLTVTAEDRDAMQ